MNAVRLLVLSAAFVTTSARAELRVPAFTAYLEPGSGGVSISEKSGITRWNDPPAKVLDFLSHATGLRDKLERIGTKRFQHAHDHGIYGREMYETWSKVLRLK
jgi:hypothetical protein